MRPKKIILAGLVLLVVLTTIGCSSGSDAQVAVPGNPAPDFSLPDLEGQSVSLDSFRGKPVLLNFWATWCGPCRGEMPYLQRVSENTEWQDKGLVILAVDYGETSAEVKKFIEANHYTFNVLLDSKGSVGNLYNVSGIPVTYFIDEDGIIVDVKIGAFASELDIHKMIANMILDDSR